MEILLNESGYLTEEQAEFYRVEGYLVLKDILDEFDLAPIREALMDKVSEIADELIESGIVDDPMVDAPFEKRLAYLFKGRPDSDFLKFGRGWRDRHPGCYEIMRNPKILDAVESLIGPEIFSSPIYNVRPKVPGVAAGAVPWHQDKSYWPDANANPVITVWIPLVETNDENGCLMVWPRTQHTKLLSYHHETITSTKYLEIDEKHLVGKKEISLPVKPGDMILFNDRCIHASGPNKSSGVRWSLDLRYQPTDQDPMPQHGAGFLARSELHPERVATVNDWLAERPEHE